MNKVQAKTKQADTKKAPVSTTTSNQPTKEVETMNTATAQATVKTSDVAKNTSNTASNNDVVKTQEQPKADNKMNTNTTNAYQNAKDGVKVEDTKAAAPVAPKTEQTNSTIAVKEEKMAEEKKTLTFSELKARIDELSAFGSEISDELDAELDSLKAIFKKLRNERQSQLVNVQASITQFVADGYNLKDMLGGFTDVELKSLVMGANIKPNELFDIAVLKEVVFGPNKKKAAAADGEEGAGTRMKRTSDKNTIFIKQWKPAGSKGKVSQYHQGRVYEEKIGDEYVIGTVATKKSFAPKPSPFFLEHSTYAAWEKANALTPEGKAYFATEEGKKELADLEGVLASYKKK